MTTDYSETLLSAIDSVAKKRIESVQFDYTNTYTITNADFAKNGQYTVTNGSIEFFAYSSNTGYLVGESVYVMIPNNDFSQQKIIVGKQITEDTTPFVFTRPFDSIVDVSTNLILGEVEEKGLTANEPETTDNEEAEKILIKEIDLSGQQIVGFTRLGIQAQFKSWLRALKTVDGTYGLELELITENSETGIVSSYLQKCKTELASVAEVLANSPIWAWFDKVGAEEKVLNFWNKFKSRYNIIGKIATYIEEQVAELGNDFLNTFKNNLSDYLTEEITENVQQTYVLDFSNYDMYGNTYQFESFYQQEQVYDISEINGRIVGMKLYFYQKPGTFKNENGEEIEYKDFLGNVIAHNIFTKDPYICVGYDVRDFNNNQVTLYTTDNSSYRYSNNFKNIEKTVQLRWIHRFNNDKVLSIKSGVEYSELENNGGYEIRWYKRKQGAPSPDEYGGVDWERVEEENQKKFSYSFTPNTDLSSEKIKAIVIYNGGIYYSNIITFINEEELVSKITLDSSKALTLWCEDDTYGNYMIYDNGNSLLNTDDGNQVRKLTCKFNAQAERNEGTATTLNEALLICWRIPASNTMIMPYDNDFDEPSFNKDNYANNDISSILESMELDSLSNILNKISSGLTFVKELTNNLKTINNRKGLCSQYLYDSTTDEIVIIWVGDTGSGNQIYPSLNYRINKYYNNSDTNNTIKCTIYKDLWVYEAIKEFTFGVAGTTGTDYTLVIDFDNGENAITYKTDLNDDDFISFTARLYDYSNKEVDIYDFTNTNQLTYEWEWLEDSYYSNKCTIEAFSNEQSTVSDLLRISIDGAIAQNNKYPNRIKVYTKNISMNDLLYLKLTVKGWGDYDLTTVLPVPIRRYIPFSLVQCSHYVGPTIITYGSDGYPYYYSNPLKMYYTNDRIDIQGFEIHNPNNEEYNLIGEIGNSNGQQILKPAGVYFEGAKQYGVQYKISNTEDNLSFFEKLIDSFLGGEVYWTQPIYVSQNLYPSSSINKWNGKTIVTDDNEATIIARGLAAGKKNSNNTFSGVMLGDWSGTKTTVVVDGESITTSISKEVNMTGIYGYKEGAMTYAFREDGTAFIGASGQGRINFSGEKGLIYSDSAVVEDTSKRRGMLINLSDGYINIFGKNTNDETAGYINFYNSGYIKFSDNGHIDIKKDGYINIEENGYINIKGEGSFTIEQNGSFNILGNGKIDISGQGYIKLGENVFLSTGKELDDGSPSNSYFYIKGYEIKENEELIDGELKYLININHDEYYLQSYDQNIKLDLANSSLIAKDNFTLEAGNKNGDFCNYIYFNTIGDNKGFTLFAGKGMTVNIPAFDYNNFISNLSSVSTGKRLCIDSNAEKYPFYIANGMAINNANTPISFSIDWDGNMTAKTGTIGGWSFFQGRENNKDWNTLYSTNNEYSMTLDAGLEYPLTIGTKNLFVNHSDAPFKVKYDGTVYVKNLILADAKTISIGDQNYQIKSVQVATGLLINSSTGNKVTIVTDVTGEGVSHVTTKTLQLNTTTINTFVAL